MFFSLPYGIEIILRFPQFLWLFASIPFFWLIVLGASRGRKKALKTLWIKEHLAGANLPGIFERFCWWFFFTVAMAFLIIVLSEPERRHTTIEKRYGGVRLTLIYDVSPSMKAAEDIHPNRMAAAKKFAAELVGLLHDDPELHGRYPMALIPFANAAIPFYSLFTTSREEILSLIASLDVGVVDAPGTSVWAALRAYDELILWYPPEDRETVDIGILISDGGKEEGKLGERILIPQAVKDLRDPYRTQLVKGGQRIITRSGEKTRNVVLYSVGLGEVTVDGSGRRVPAEVPLMIRDRAGNLLGYMHKDPTNPQSPVLKSALDESILREVAETYGGGRYFHFENSQQLLAEVRSALLKYRKEAETIPHYRYESISAWFLMPAFSVFYFLFGYGGWLSRVARATKMVLAKIVSKLHAA